MNTLYDELIKILMNEDKYVSNDNALLKNKVYEDAMNMDENLIKLLFDNELTKEKFFKKINNFFVFDKIEFGWVINNKEFLPDSYTRFKNKIGLSSTTGKYIINNDDVVIDFPYKDCVLVGGQTKDEEKRNELFYNKILASSEIDSLFAPKVFTNAKRYTKDGIETNINFQPNDNLIIKGNNLLVLSSLLKRYESKINLIYIDPPFNTGNDSFNYNDRFNRSTWLTFMKNRLELAKKLLTSDGNIFIHIDVNQSHYLKVLCDEIFGKDNFVEEIIWAYGSPSGGRASTPKPVNVHDYILHYAKNYQLRKQNRVYTPYSQKYIDEWFKYEDEDGRKYRRRLRGKDENGENIWIRQYLDESKGVPLSTVWTDIKQVYADPRAYADGQEEFTEIEKDFRGGQKPEALLKRIIEMATDERDLVLDFHLGTGTTCAVAHKMNRQYIGVEQMDYIENFVVNRLEKVIKGDKNGISKDVNWNDGGSFVYCELKKLNDNYIEKILSATSKDLENIYDEISKSVFVNFNTSIQILNENKEDFKNLDLESQRKILIDILDMNMLYQNYSDIEDSNYNTLTDDVIFNKSFYEEI